MCESKTHVHEYQLRYENELQQCKQLARHIPCAHTHYIYCIKSRGKQMKVYGSDTDCQQTISLKYDLDNQAVLEC